MAMATTDMILTNVESLAGGGSVLVPLALDALDVVALVSKSIRVRSNTARFIDFSF